MSNYTKATNFATKDALTTGNPLKTLSGTELNVEFDAIATAVTTKANASNAALTGTPTAPTASADTNTTQVATTAFVTTEANLKLDLAGGALTGALTTNSTIDGRDVAADGVLATNAMPKSGGAFSGAVTTDSTFDGVDIATRDGVLSATKVTADAALPKAGGTMTGVIAGFDSTGIADNATATKLTVSDVGIGVGITPELWDSSTESVQLTSGALWAYLTSQLNLSQNTYYDGAYKHLNIGEASSYDQTGGVHYFKVASSGAADTAITFKNALTIANNGDISFYEDTGSTPKFHWDASAESLGIGTSTPAAILHLDKATVGEYFRGGSGNTRHLNISSFDTASPYAGHNFNASSGNGVLSFSTGSTERMRIESSGNVGIGTSSPYTPLEVSAADPIIRLTDNNGTADISTWEMRVVGSAAEGLIFRQVNDANNVYTNRMIINNSGVMLLGTNSENGADGITINGASGNTPYILSNTSNVASTHFYFRYNSGTVGTIATSATSTSYNTSSDYRLKTDVQPMTGATATFKQLKPVSFEWIADGTRVDGFLAHELQEVIPAAATGTKDAMVDEEYEVTAATGDIYTAGSEAGFNEVSPAIQASPAYYDINGVVIKAEVLAVAAVHEAYDAVLEIIHSSGVVNPTDLEEGQQWRETTAQVMATRSVPDMQGIDQSKVVPLLVATLQEALDTIEALTLRIEALEA